MLTTWAGQQVPPASAAVEPEGGWRAPSHMSAPGLLTTAAAAATERRWVTFGSKVNGLNAAVSFYEYAEDGRLLHKTPLDIKARLINISNRRRLSHLPGSACVLRLCQTEPDQASADAPLSLIAEWRIRLLPRPGGDRELLHPAAEPDEVELLEAAVWLCARCVHPMRAVPCARYSTAGHQLTSTSQLRGECQPEAQAFLCRPLQHC
jgi:hypothetical protein